MWWIVGLVALVALFVSASCLRLDAPDGALSCSDDAKRLCPAGYYCLAGDDTCWRVGHFPDDMAEPQPFIPGEDQGVPQDLSPELDLGVSDLATVDLLPNDDLLDTD